MEWTSEKVIGVGIIAFLVMTLVFASTTGIVDKTKNAQTKATAKVDSVVTAYQ